MSIDEYKKNAREALDTLYDIEDQIEDALADSDDYWSWAGFFKDKMDTLMPVKETGKEAVSTLQDSVDALKTELEESKLQNFFDEIDKNKDAVKEVVDEIRDTADITTVALHGETLAELLQDLLDEFRNTSESVENLLEAIEKSES